MTTVKDNRPVYLDLTKIKEPIPAIASLLHRVSGVLIFLALPILLWLMDRSLVSEETFNNLQDILGNPIIRLIIWGILAALIYHLLAGIRHMLMDMNIGESLKGGRRGAKAVFIVSIILIILAGGWIW